MRTLRFPTWLSPALFAGILLAFLLPFATVSCSDEEVTFTGLQLALAQVPEPQGPAPFDESLAEDVEREATVWAFIALGAAVAGVVLGTLRRRGGGIAAAVGLVGELGLLWAYVATLATVDVHAGFLLGLAGFLLLAAGHAVAAIRRRLARTPARAATSPPSPAC